MFEGFDFTDFWENNQHDDYLLPPPGDELIAEVERELGYKLPASYIWLMKQHNGGYPAKTAAPSEEPTSWADDHAGINGIYGIGKAQKYSLCGSMGSRFWIDEWGYPEIGVAIADCPSGGHDMIFLDYRACGKTGEPAVVHVDQEDDYRIVKLADNFEQFIRSLRDEEEYDEDFDED